MKEKCEKISNIEVVEEIKYLEVIVQAKRNVFEGQKNEIMEKKNQKIERDDKLCHRKKLPSSKDEENILERSGATKRSVRSRSNRHERRRNRQTAKSREHCNEKNLESTKVGCTCSNKRRDRNKQHEVENSKEQSSLPKKDRNWK